MNGVKFWNTNLKSDSFEDFQLVTILDPSFLRLRFTINFVVERTRERIFRLLRIVSKTMVESMLSSVSEIPSPDEFVSIPTPPRRTRFRRKLRARYAPTIALLRHKRYFYWGATRWFDRRYFIGPRNSFLSHFSRRLAVSWKQKLGEDGRDRSNKSAFP